MADVGIPTSLLAVVTDTARGMRTVVFTTDQVGYVFAVPSARGVSVSKTTDGGATWGDFIDIITLNDNLSVAFDVWYEGWTPGDSGTLVWFTYFDATNDIVRSAAFNTATDSVVVATAYKIVFTGASAVAGRGAFVSVTKARSGYLYCAYDIDAGAERGFHRSTDGGLTWSANLSTTFVEATLDTCKLYPASNTGDNNDCWALYYDASATALTLKLWDSSAVAQVESATIQTHTDGATDLTGQFGYDASVRHSDGHLIVAALSARDVAASTHQVFDITSTSTITTKTAIAASTDDHYYPQVCIDQATDHLYVTYNGKRDGSEVLDTTTKVYYTKSTDGGTTWSAGDTAYMEGAAGVVAQVWTPLSGLRFYAVWRVGTALLGNKVNSVSLPAGPAGQSVTGAVVTSTSVVYSPQVVTPGAVTLTGTTLASGAQLFAGTVSTAGVAQAVTGTTLASGAAVTAGTVATGAVTLTGTILTSSAVVRAGTVTTLTAVTGATVPSGLVLRAGTVTTTTSVTGTTRGSTLALFPGTVSSTAAAAVGGANLASGALLFPGVVTAGAVTVVGATRSSSAQLFSGVATVAVPVAADQPFMWLM